MAFTQKISRDLKRTNIADIICIGSQKTSTSWLHHVINIHPDLYTFPAAKPFTSTNKEAHFWDKNKGKGVGWYRKLLTPPNPSLKSMDFTPEYAFIPEKLIRECHEHSPSAKVIYILRDPLSRAVSALRMHAKRSTNEADPTVHTIKFSDETLQIIKKHRVIEHSSYAANWTRWSKFYDDILVLNYEDILATPREVVQRVFDYLELDMGKLSDNQMVQFETRFEKKVWKSIEYRLDSDLLYFLHGLTWQQRKAADNKFGFKFQEYLKTLSGVTEE